MFLSQCRALGNHIVSKGENATSGDVASGVDNINDEYYELLSIESIGLQYVLDDEKEPTDTPILYYLSSFRDLISYF